MMKAKQYCVFGKHASCAKRDVPFGLEAVGWGSGRVRYDDIVNQLSDATYSVPVVPRLHSNNMFLTAR